MSHFTDAQRVYNGVQKMSSSRDEDQGDIFIERYME